MKTVEKCGERAPPTDHFDGISAKPCHDGFMGIHPGRCVLARR